ncbi:MAG: hypothetical protein B6I20_05630 [Bacteroidetes bacterium 4572_117]|nr:MAG: hypothetical protein B6I20_05630 [Bacteroidetes bacterium 4572_117]
MFLQVLLISVLLLGLAFVGFAVKIIFLKSGKFPDTKVGHNKEMRKRKIFCINTQQKIIDKNIKKIKQGNNPSCSSCT